MGNFLETFGKLLGNCFHLPVGSPTALPDLTGELSSARHLNRWPRRDHIGTWTRDRIQGDSVCRVSPGNRCNQIHFSKSRHSAVKLNVTSQHWLVDEPQVAFDPKRFPPSYCKYSPNSIGCGRTILSSPDSPVHHVLIIA
jgi:hypothetical protein